MPGMTLQVLDFAEQAAFVLDTLHECRKHFLVHVLLVPAANRVLCDGWHTKGNCVFVTSLFIMDPT